MIGYKQEAKREIVRSVHMSKNCEKRPEDRERERVKRSGRWPAAAPLRIKYLQSRLASGVG